MWSSQEVGNASDEQSIHVPDPIPSTHVKVRKKMLTKKTFKKAKDSLKRYKVVEAHSRNCKHNLIIGNGQQEDIVQHGLICSGMLPSHYTKFVDGAGIGKINKEKRNKFFNSYENHIQTEYHKSTTTALLEESASYYDDKFGEIDSLTDARHGWRKNAKYASIVAIGEKTHKVLSCQHVTKDDEVVSQRHERVGTDRVYTYLAEKEVAVVVHCHDRNLSINKYIREETDAINQTIHGIVLKQHLSCDPSSRCKYDKNYEPSRIVLTDPLAEKLLLGVLLNSNIFKYPQDYVLGKDTFYVESFNNVINIYQDKCIAFGDKQYNARSNLAVCQWNETVDRDFTSISNPRKLRTLEV
ncbi:unnamed protein product [Mytilus coruscus]|uniref:Uncharacterized protein n=1 Tax=Mytilus coruscus TaxID=42192 RepID=A0A6J8ACA2_MYTCO|nr:unnamed protein product [Mytilus coruscus]